MNGEEKEKEKEKKKAGGSGCSDLPSSGSAGSFGVVTFNERILRPEFDEATKCFHELLDEIVTDVAFDVHWSHKTGITSRNHEYVDVNTINTSNASNAIVSCPVCDQTIAGVRFAAHLEKCLNGGQRVSGKRSRSSAYNNSNGGRGNRSENSDGSSSPFFDDDNRKSGQRSSDNVSKPPKRRYIYGSMVVRIKFKDGAPLPNSKRETVSYSTFLMRQRAREKREREAAAVLNSPTTVKVEANIDCDKSEKDNNINDSGSLDKSKRNKLKIASEANGTAS